MSFEIITDSSCNLSCAQIAEHNIHIIPLAYIVGGQEKLSCCNDSEETLKEYYELMRQKTPITTSCVNRECSLPIFEEILKSGKDILYIGFSSALSATFNVVKSLIEELKPKYANQKIYYVDSLCASLGQGMLVMDVALLKSQGKNIDAVYDYAQDNKYKLCHLFTVDSLSYLYHGGRVKKTAFLVASTLNIKPILHVDNSGSLTAMSKAFGRKSSLNSIAKKLAATITNPESQTVYISHGDCIKDVEYLIERIKEHSPVKSFLVNYVDLVIGAHSGPGTIAVFYYGTSRE